MDHKALSDHVRKAVTTLFAVELESVELQQTRKEFEGDITVVIFPMLRSIKGNPVQIGEQIGNYLESNLDEVSGFNVIKGFLNLSFSDADFLRSFYQVSDYKSYGQSVSSGEAIMVEFSSPNTNKPLHLGHIRNILLGDSVSRILSAAGAKVYKTQIINDRGIHICKSMLAWKRHGKGATPKSTGSKGDKFVGDFYVRFDQDYKVEVARLIEDGMDEETAKKSAPSLLEAQQMLRNWESGDEETVALWKKMNSWVYDGFETTYSTLGVAFDSYYYESDTYLLGKDNIEEGLAKGVFFKKEDGSVWCDLTDEGLDEKLVLRSDGTAVYMTQDIGTAIQRVKDHPDITGMIYTVGNEQDYHFKVLFLILKKLGYTWAENLYHLSYGMVDLPSGKMKSREGTVVDADDLMQQMFDTAGNITAELGKLEGYSLSEKQALYRVIGLGALKYYILKVDPRKRILFNPEESVDFQGNTGPFIQYTYARIQSILRKAEDELELMEKVDEVVLHEKEKEVLKQLHLYPEVVQQAAKEHSPALIANFTYELVKAYNSFFQNVPIFRADSDDQRAFRVQLSGATGEVIRSAFGLLGIEVPDRM